MRHRLQNVGPADDTGQAACAVDDRQPLETARDHQVGRIADRRLVADAGDLAAHHVGCAQIGTGAGDRGVDFLRL